MPDHPSLPELHSFADVIHWVIDELDAMCPSPERLAAYAAHPHDPQFSDVRFHVEEAGCRLCQAELDELR
jgi:hypothetical protein